MTESSDPISITKMAAAWLLQFINKIEQFTYYLKNPGIFKDVNLCKTPVYYSEKYA